MEGKEPINTGPNQKNAAFIQGLWEKSKYVFNSLNVDHKPDNYDSISEKMQDIGTFNVFLFQLTLAKWSTIIVFSDLQNVILKQTPPLNKCCIGHAQNLINAVAFTSKYGTWTFFLSMLALLEITFTAYKWDDFAMGCSFLWMFCCTPNSTLAPSIK